MARRLKSTAYIIVSQGLLIALAVSWTIHMLLIAVNGSVYFVEDNPIILWLEIGASVLIAVFAVFVLANQIRKLGERRRTDNRVDSSRKIILDATGTREALLSSDRRDGYG